MVKKTGPHPVKGNMNEVKSTPVREAMDMPTKNRALIWPPY